MSFRKKPLLPPINADFPTRSPFPLFNAVSEEVENNVQAPRPLIVFSLLTAISVSVQGLFDVRKPNGQVVPASLLLLAIAESGERKSSLENVFLDPIREFQRSYEVIWTERFLEWEVQNKIWQVKNKALLKKLSLLTAKMHCSKDVELELGRCQRSRPIKPRQFKMLYDDSTSEALFHGLHENLSSAGLISSEGGLKGRAFNDLSKQSAMWSGDPVVVDRKAAESYELHGARLTVSTMTQPSAFQLYMSSHGQSARGSGLWARFLVCYPESTQGSRVIKNLTTSWCYVSHYKCRIEELLNKNLELLSDSGKKREVVVFSPGAKELWLDVHNEIELEISSRGRFFEAGDLASKLTDNIARVAAILHVFEGDVGDVSLKALEFSIDFCTWCSDEFYRLFMPPKELDVDVARLLEWLDSKRHMGIVSVRKNEIMQYGPRSLRVKRRLDSCLEELVYRGEVTVCEKRGALYVRSEF